MVLTKLWVDLTKLLVKSTRILVESPKSKTIAVGTAFVKTATPPAYAHPDAGEAAQAHGHVPEREVLPEPRDAAARGDHRARGPRDRASAGGGERGCESKSCGNARNLPNLREFAKL